MQNEIGHRLFFALWPDDVVRRAIMEAFHQTPQAAMRAKQVHPDNIHITLHFIGQVSEAQKVCLQEAAKTVAGEAFALQLDRYGHFYKARVFWLGCNQLPDALKHLHALLATALAECGYKAETRPFAPHVTLLRKLLKPGVLIPPPAINWPVREFVMVESITNSAGVQYRVIERYPLG